MVWFLLHNNGRKSIHASLCMQSIMNANNFSSDHIETYKHAVTHAHIITHLFFFLKSRAPERFPFVSLWLCSVSEGLRFCIQIQTPTLSPWPPSPTTGRSGPTVTALPQGYGVVGWIFLQAWRSSPGRQLVPTLQNVWMDSQMPTLACSL